MENSGKVKATWYRLIYYYRDQNFGDEWVWSYNFDDKNSREVENPKRIAEYDSIDDAIEDFLKNNVCEADDVIFDKCQTPYKLLEEYPLKNDYLYVQHWKPYKKDEKGEYVYLDLDEIDKMYEESNIVVQYQFHDVLNLEYVDGSDANQDALKIYNEKFRKQYENVDKEE